MTFDKMNLVWISSLKLSYKLNIIIDKNQYMPSSFPISTGFEKPASCHRFNNQR